MQSDVRRRGVRPTSKRRTVRRDSEINIRKSDKKRMWQLVVCLCVFVSALIFKFFFPAGASAVSTSILQEIGKNGSYKETFAAIGEAISSGGSVSAAFKELANAVFSPNTEYENTSSGEIMPHNKAYSANGSNGKWAISPQSRTGLPVPGSIEAESYEALGAGGGEIYDGDEFIDEFLLKLSPEDESDGSPYEMFDIPAPERVSFEYMEFAFDYVSPLSGIVTSAFGYRTHPIDGGQKFHYGIDIGAASGTPIFAFSDGVVESAGTNEIYGNYLFIRHTDGTITFYGHCKSILVKRGDTVLKGSTVALVGSTGKSTGPHLHFEIRNGNIILDPTPYIDAGN